MNAAEMGECRTALSEIAGFLEKGQQHLHASALREALSDSALRFVEFLISNDLWGGSGSLADSSFTHDPSHPEWKVNRAGFEALMIRLGRLQIAAGWVNPRTRMWVEVFERWRHAGLR
jgi:hypothetical protein